MNNDISKKLWNVFEIATHANKEAIALFEYIDVNIASIKLNAKRFKERGSILTNTYVVVPKKNKKIKYLVGVQIVFYDEETSFISGQSVLNVIIKRDKGKDPFSADNWFAKGAESNDWDCYSLHSNMKTVCDLSDKDDLSEEYNDILFSVPLNELKSPDAVDVNVIFPLKKLIKYLNPDSDKVIKAFEKAVGVINLKDNFEEGVLDKS